MSSPRPRVYVTQPVASSAIRRLAERADVAVNPDPLHTPTKAELMAAVRDADFLFCLLQDVVDRDVIAAGAGLRAIASMTIIPADIDVAAATERRIPVTVIPPIVTEATADLAMALLLAVARRVAEADRLMRAGTFPGAQSCYLEGRGVTGATLGLLGCGRVGQAVARRARGFGMRLLYHDPRRLPEADERALGLEYRTMKELLGDADFVSVHVPLTPETRHLIGPQELGQMKRTAYLINTARGPIVDEKALVAALAEGRLAGAGLDVYEHEPRPDSGLLSLPAVVLTPHVGSGVVELRERMAQVVVDNILAVMDGQRPPNCVNAEIYRGG
jgi:glyoxylate reductase